MKPEERDAVRAALAELVDALDAGPGLGTQRLHDAIDAARAALTAQSPAGVPPEPFLLADTYGMLSKLTDALAGVPTTEPVAPESTPWDTQTR